LSDSGRSDLEYLRPGVHRLAHLGSFPDAITAGKSSTVNCDMLATAKIQQIALDEPLQPNVVGRESRAGPPLQRPTGRPGAQLALPELADQDRAHVLAAQVLHVPRRVGALPPQDNVVLHLYETGAVWEVEPVRAAGQDLLAQLFRGEVGAGRHAALLPHALEDALLHLFAAPHRHQGDAELAVVLVVDGHAPEHVGGPAGLRPAR